MRTTIDGVPVFHRNVPGPMKAALLFRVGSADEQLHERGITHLLEHLTLTKAPDQVHAFNGSTGAMVTQFVTAGEPDDVVDFLHLVCAGLREPALERLEHERSVLRAEEAQRSYFSGTDQLIWRWGPKGFASSVYAEWGAPVATPEQLAAWSAKYFHSGNCVLWMSGAPPRGLRLELPAGAGVAPLPADVIEPVVPLPSRYPRSRAEPAFSWVLPSRRGAAVLGALVGERLTARLRHESGLSYGSHTYVERLGGDAVLQMFFVDATDDNARDVQAGVLAVIRELRERPVEAAELKKISTMALLAMQEGDAALAHLDHWARESLLGQKPVTIEESRAQWGSLTPDVVSAAVEDALPSLLLGVPFPDEVPNELAQRAPLWTGKVYRGSLVKPAADVPDRALRSLYLGPDGVSLVVGEDDALSIAVADVVAVFRFDEGSHQVFSRDGTVLTLPNEDWSHLEDITRWVDALPPGLVHPGGHRTPRQPRETTPRSTAKRTAPVRVSWVRFALPAVAALIAVSGGLAHRGATEDPAADPLDSSTSDLGQPRFGLPTHLSAGDCFNDTDTVVPCRTSHEHEVLKGSGLVSSSDVVDQLFCEQLFQATSASRNGQFALTEQLQTRPDGSADLLCVVTPNDGTSKGSASAG